MPVPAVRSILLTWDLRQGARARARSSLIRSGRSKGWLLTPRYTIRARARSCAQTPLCPVSVCCLQARVFAGQGFSPLFYCWSGYSEACPFQHPACGQSPADCTHCLQIPQNSRPSGPCRSHADSPRHSSGGTGRPVHVRGCPVADAPCRNASSCREGNAAAGGTIRTGSGRSTFLALTACPVLFVLFMLNGVASPTVAADAFFGLEGQARATHATCATPFPVWVSRVA